jgi:hypothetical protein
VTNDPGLTHGDCDSEPPLSARSTFEPPSPTHHGVQDLEHVDDALVDDERRERQAPVRHGTEHHPLEQHVQAQQADKERHGRAPRPPIQLQRQVRQPLLQVTGRGGAVGGMMMMIDGKVRNHKREGHRSERVDMRRPLRYRPPPLSLSDAQPQQGKADSGFCPLVRAANLGKVAEVLEHAHHPETHDVEDERLQLPPAVEAVAVQDTRRNEDL